jgi:Spy/CpxP family protein refolding chaperone
VFKRKLDIDEDQEDLVDLAMKDARGTAKDLGQALHATRDDLAEAFRSHTVDDAGIAAVFASHDEEIARARREMISALKQIHAVLDPEQRERAADLLARGNGPRWV